MPSRPQRRKAVAEVKTVPIAKGGITKKSGGKKASPARSATPPTPPVVPKPVINPAASQPMTDPVASQPMTDPVVPIRAVRLVSDGSVHLYGNPVMQVFDEMPNRQQRRENAVKLAKENEYRDKMYQRFGFDWIETVAAWNEQGGDGSPPPEFKVTNRLAPDAWKRLLPVGKAVTNASPVESSNGGSNESDDEESEEDPTPKVTKSSPVPPKPRGKPEPAPPAKPAPLKPRGKPEPAPSKPRGNPEPAPPKPRGKSSPKTPVKKSQTAQSSPKRVGNTEPKQAETEIAKENAKLLLDAVKAVEDDKPSSADGDGGDIDMDVVDKSKVDGDKSEVDGCPPGVPPEIQSAANVLLRLVIPPPPVLQIMSPIGDSGCNHKFETNRPTLVPINVGSVGIAYGQESQSLFDALLPNIHFTRVRIPGGGFVLKSWEQLMTESPIMLQHKLVDAIHLNTQTIRNYILHLVADGVVSPSDEDFLSKVSLRIKTVTAPEFGLAEMGALINLSVYQHAETEGAVGISCVPSFTLFELVQPEDVQATLKSGEEYNFPPIASCGGKKYFSAFSNDTNRNHKQANCLAVLVRKGVDGSRIYRRLLVDKQQSDEQIRSREFKDACNIFDEMLKDQKSLEYLTQWINAKDKEIEQLRAAAIKIGTAAKWKLPA